MVIQGRGEIRGAFVNSTAQSEIAFPVSQGATTNWWVSTAKNWQVCL